MNSLKIFSVCCFLFVIAGKGFAQQSNYADSILNQLKLIKGGDSKYNIYFDSAIALMGKNKKEVLLENKSIMSELDRLQAVVDESKYCILYVTFYKSHFSLDSMPNEALIKFGRAYIEKIKLFIRPVAKVYFFIFSGKRGSPTATAVIYMKELNITLSSGTISLIKMTVMAQPQYIVFWRAFITASAFRKKLNIPF